MNFTNTSTGSINTYAWTFGDGTSSTAPGPSHVYSAAGVYTVSLTVTGSGGSNTKTVPGYVTVTAPPSVDTSPPTAPSALAASAAGSAAINLAWQASMDNVGVTGYRIERCQGAGCTAFGQIATSTGTTFSNTGLAAGVSYSYRVRATDAAGECQRVLEYDHGRDDACRDGTGCRFQRHSDLGDRALDGEFLERLDGNDQLVCLEFRRRYDKPGAESQPCVFGRRRL